MIWVMSLFAWLVGVAAMTLDYSVYYTVIVMGDYVHNLTAVGVTWRILRDIGNIMLIFGFLAIGISIILNTDRLGYGKKMLPMLLVAAVFINFSLFMTEAVIDVGNLFATQFFTQINGGQTPTHASLEKLTTGTEGISSKIMLQLGLQNIYGDARKSNKQIFKSNAPSLIAFMGILLFIVTAFVMFALAFILIARFIALIFLIIVAPIGFAGFAIPQLKGLANDWQHKLFEQTITAPVLLLMLYIALAVITDAQFLTGFGLGSSSQAQGFWTGTIGNGNLAGFGEILLSFLVAMGLLVAVIFFAKKLGAVGAARAMNFGQKAATGATKFVGRQTWSATRGATRWTARQTGGRLAANLAQRVRTSDTFAKTQLGRITATTLDKGSKGFRELETATAKKHEEYVKSVDKALEEKHLPAVVAAQRERYDAEKAAGTKDAQEMLAKLKAEHETAEKEAKPVVDELKRLEEIIRTKPEIDSDRIEAEKNLSSARAKAAAAEARVTKAASQLEAANEPLKSAKTKEKEATDALSKAKKKAAIEYADNLQAKEKSPLMGVAKFVVSGTHSNAAANKIIKDRTKKGENFKEAVEKILKDAEPKEETPKEGAKPAATPAPIHPPEH